MWHYISDTVPKDREVLLAVLDFDGFHVLDFPCRYSDDCRWINMRTGHSVDIRPTHWREWLADID
jgi:hypothetical protein